MVPAFREKNLWKMFRVKPKLCASPMHHKVSGADACAKPFTDCARRAGYFGLKYQLHDIMARFSGLRLLM